jgi:hypothetical protein
MTTQLPKYSIWEAVNAALRAGTKALEEVRTLARQPGPKGKDGLGFDDMDFAQTGDRSFVLRFSRGGEVKEYPLTVPSMIDRGVFKAGAQYDCGDAVSWAGSLWIAQRATSEKPDGPSSGWRLAVKKGRDGKDAGK